MNYAELHVEPQTHDRTKASAYKHVIDVLSSSLNAGFPPSVQLAVVDQSSVALRAWGGLANTFGKGIPANRDTSYDLASLTKVVGTTTLALWLGDEEVWHLSDPVSKWLPDFPRDDITLLQLITHTSGLTPYRPFYLLAHDVPGIRSALYSEAKGARPGHVVYSDLNFMLLGWAIAACAGQPLNHLFRDIVALPLGMTRTRFCPLPSEQLNTAATELISDDDPDNAPSLIWGKVHDRNARALSGISGHAGLFGPCDDLARFLIALLSPSTHTVLSAASIDAMAQPCAGKHPELRGLGWRLAPSGWGPWPASTYWHTGFTGTSLLVSPDFEVGVVLLSNAIHPVRQLERQALWRANVHNAIAQWIT